MRGIEKSALSPSALRILQEKYLRKNKKGQIIETIDEMFRRVAKTVASADILYDPNADIEKTENSFFYAMRNLEFLPNSPTLMNAGTECGQLAACFVLPVGDSINEIFDAIKFSALIHRTGGGTGFSFSNLRPKGDLIKTTFGQSSGPISFMRIFDMATEEMKRGGRRRGANMGVLSVHHPDIIEFVKAKQNGISFQNFNLSVSVTDRFMEAVKSDAYYDLVNPRTEEKVMTLRAKKVFHLIVDMAWSTGDPGLIFIDRINIDNPTPSSGWIESTNPCGEQPLLPYESCNLGSINLLRMVENDKIDYERLKKVVRIALHFLDNIIDINKSPLPKIEEVTKRNRKIGLGVMGFADMLIKLGIPYDSQDTIKTINNLMKVVSSEARRKSIELAKERGVFPNYKLSVYSKKNEKLRNATLLTIAPTGTLSIIAGCSSGIEPLFSIAYVRHMHDGNRLIEINPCFRQLAIERGFYSEKLVKKIAKQGSLKGLNEVSEEIKRLFVTSHEISSDFHVRVQATFQQYVDNAVSKTVNLPNNTAKEDVARIFLLAYNLGCKGITIYRDRSRSMQVLNIGIYENPRCIEKVNGEYLCVN